MKVVFLNQADYAGSAYQAVKAINSVGRIEARQIVCHKDVYGFESDLVLPSAGTSWALGGWRSVEDSPEYPEACRLLDEADLIHCWNDEYHDYLGKADTETKAFRGDFPSYPAKYRSVTFTGTWYRRNWKDINRRLLANGTQLVVQTPAFIMEEMPSVYIPHSIDTNALRPIPISEKNFGTIGCYPHRITTANADIELFGGILRAGYPGWRLVLEERSSHKERLGAVSKCMFFMQDLDDRMINYGRSSLEAATLGVPVINSLCPQAKELMPDIPFLVATPDTLKEVWASAMTMDYNELSERTRAWAVKYHDYSVVGEKYTKFFEGLM